MDEIPKWKQLRFRAEGAEAGRLSDLLRETAHAMDALGELTVLDMTFHSVLTADGELKPIIDVYYALDDDVEVSGAIPAGSNVVYHASQASPTGTGSAGAADLLKKFADETIGCLGDVSVESVVFKPLVGDGDGEVGQSMTVYYTTG
ncbi:hypothetical protein [Nocardia sp. NBC_00416]|uniref:hypothetical protein n=1 Tax=Nocardia sp. NBC_00416 TaxID=2975991 RepID=UPI002E1DE373